MKARIVNDYRLDALASDQRNETLFKVSDAMNRPTFDLLSKSDHAELRKSARGDVTIRADIRVPAVGSNKVRVLDLSQTGFRIESLTLLPTDRVIYLTIPGFAQLEARIAWRTDWLYGCKFACPLHPAIFDHIVRTHPALAHQMPG